MQTIQYGVKTEQQIICIYVNILKRISAICTLISHSSELAPSLSKLKFNELDYSSEKSPNFHLPDLNTACPSPEETVESCNPVTCLERVHRITWALDSHDAQCHRLPPQLLKRPCCCPPRVDPNEERNRCVPETGQLEIVRIIYQFDPTRRVCEPQQIRQLKPLGELFISNTIVLAYFRRRFF